jgi:hypothetical protein
MLVGLGGLFTGAVLAVGSAAMDTTQSAADGSGRIYNIGLIGKQESGTILGGAMAIAGAVLFVGGWIVDAVQSLDDRLGPQAEKKSKSSAAPAPYFPPYQEPAARAVAPPVPPVPRSVPAARRP